MDIQIVVRTLDRGFSPAPAQFVLKMKDTLNYVLITPARNEAQYIELTIRSMVAQTLPPLKWVIVSDGSTDDTDEIVGKYVSQYPWIELLRMPERQERHFAGKVHAFNAGYERVGHLDFEVIGNLDGDVSFEPEHFEFLIGKMGENAGLGVAGAPFREGTFQYDYRFTNIENVWGGCQLFRRECYEAIGGYLPLKGGCIDHVAVLSARLHGWQTRTFTEKVCVHHRQMGTAMHSALNARFRLGVKDYTVGNHPLWELARTIYQMKNRPLVIGGLALGSGYAWSLVRRAEIPLSSELVAFVRREQINRLKRFFGGKSQATSGRIVEMSRSE
jgi:poly-beta-1,6-N-acetyl-D-glucosamine synthase